MKDDSGQSSSLRESSRRVTIMVLVISGHLGLLMLLLRPAILHLDTTPMVRNNWHALKLRFFRPSQSSHQTLSAHRLIAPAVHRRTAPPAGSSKPLTVQQAAHADAPPYPLRSIHTLTPDTSEENSTSDGGFQARLRHAQRSYSVRGLPGSDTHFAPGIHLVDPMNQGIGAVMRATQRAFGIKNRHCIDVDVWRHLTPQELSARHISPGDVDETDEKYGCSKPPGLHF